MPISAPVPVKGTRPTSVASTAFEAYLAADYAHALALVRSPDFDGPEAERRVIEARVLLHSGDPSGAALAAAEARCAARDDDERTLAAALQGAALARAGQPAKAARCFAEARKTAVRGHRTVRAELGYLEAVDAWSAGDIARAEALLEAALCDGDDVVTASLLQLQGWLEVRRERYADAARQFEDALDAAQRSAYRDVRLEARLIHALAVIASETIDLRLAGRLERRMDSVIWSTGVKHERFNTMTCLRFIALLRGELEAAYRYGQLALELAPDDAFRAIAHTNQFALLALAGDRFVAQVHVSDARCLIGAVEWRKADVEQRVALTNYVIEAAARDPSGASQFLTLYRSITERKNTVLVLEGDRRVDAFTDMADGRLAEALGKPERAIAAYQRSLRRWTALDYRMRAAIVAADLHRLTGDDQYLEDVRAALRRAPRAWFGDRVSRDAPEKFPRLTSAQRRVLDELLKGKSSKAIANALERSDNTVRNQTKAIFAAFGVRSRASLLAQCARDGVLDYLKAAD